MSSEMDQAFTRRPGKLKDHHGRPWDASIEKRSGYPTGPIQLMQRTPSGQVPPWVPDQGYFVFSDNPYLFTIDYTRMLTERRQAHAAYFQEAVGVATARTWAVPKKGEPIAHEIALIIGKAPQPIEPIIAAMQENSWILGYTDEVDPRLEAFVVRPTVVEEMLADLPDFSDAALLGEAAFADFEATDEPEAPVRRKHRKSATVEG